MNNFNQFNKEKIYQIKIINNKKILFVQKIKNNILNIELNLRVMLEQFKEYISQELGINYKTNILFGSNINVTEFEEEEKEININENSNKNCFNKKEEKLKENIKQHLKQNIRKRKYQIVSLSKKREILLEVNFF